MRDGRQFEWGGQGGAPHRLTEVTIRRDLKEVREQSPPGPRQERAGAGWGSGRNAAVLSAEQDVRAGQTGPPT